tara:strand:+ start:1040 stop:1183 length:144 start_codon:yes stop_codon:yes gene_type:complete
MRQKAFELFEFHKKHVMYYVNDFIDTFFTKRQKIEEIPQGPGLRVSE